MAQAIAHAAQAMFGSNGQQNRNNGPGSGADLGKAAQNGSLAHNTGGVAANTNAATGSQTQATTSAQSRQTRQAVEAEVYGEKSNATTAGYEAMTSVIINRANSGDRQYVNSGKAVNLNNVLERKGAFQARGTRPYNAFLRGRASQSSLSSVRSAVTHIIENGPTTNATFFIANPHGRSPTAAQVHALGNIMPARPPEIDGIYLYVPRPPGY